MAFVKDMLRMWAHSWKRFISIAMITLLGVAVLTGIYAGCRDAFRSTDRFFDAQGLHDVQVLSTAGLSNGDIAALRKVNVLFYGLWFRAWELVRDCVVSD